MKLLKETPKFVDDTTSLAIALDKVHEHENGDISRALHDELGQLLSYSSVLLKNIQEKQKIPTDIQELVGKTVQNQTRMLDLVRLLCLKLRPQYQTYLPIQDFLSAFLTDIRNRSDLEIEFVHDGNFQDISLHLSSTLSRIVQAAVDNVLQHAEATSVTISFVETKNAFVLSIEDNGIGIQPEQIDMGYGILGMKSRLQLHRGSLEIRKGGSAGTVVQASIPKSE